MATAKANRRAPALWLRYYYPDDGDILMSEVYVHNEAPCTYYCCLQWNAGAEGGGYCGLQSHPGGGRAIIFSLWDPRASNAPITTVSKDPGTTTSSFGGEGTGLKAMNFSYNWQPHHWYSIMARRWNSPTGGTRFGCWIYDYGNGRWTHIVTMEYPVSNVFFSGSAQAFLEDWCSSGQNYRAVSYNNVFKRRLDHRWIPFIKANFDLNTDDINRGIATRNWDARCSVAASGFLLAAGGTVQPTDPRTNQDFTNVAAVQLPKMNIPGLA